MLLILEIVLTIAAWHRGWRGWALLPLLGGMALAFLIGTMAGAMELTADQVETFPLVLLPIDIVAIGLLAWMTTRGRNRRPTNIGEATQGELAVPDQAC